MYKKILVPLDGSEFSECILSHVKAVATGCQVPEVMLLYVVEPVRQPARAHMDSSVLDQAHRDSISSAKDYLSRVASDLRQSGVAAETMVVEGNAAEQILDYAGRNQVDLIMMSTHGRSGITRWAAGSVTDRVLRHAVAPVLVAAPAACRVS